MFYNKHIMNLHLFDDGGSDGSGGSGAASGTGGNGGSGNGGQGNHAGYTFEQAEQIANARAEQATRAALAGYFRQQGLSEQEVTAAIADFKEKQKANKPDIDAIQKERDQYKAQIAERDNKDYLRDKNVKAEDIDYVMFKASQLVDDKTDFKKAADKFLKDNPRYAGGGYRMSASSGSQAPGSSESKNTSINDAIRNAARH